MEPYYKDDWVTIYHGDSLNVLPLMTGKCNMILTDPFYGSSGRDGSVHLEKDHILGNRMSSDSFVWFVRQYSSMLYDFSENDSHCYIFSDWRKYKDVQIAFETNFWELRQLIVWNKQNGMGEFWRSSHEFILFFTKRFPRKLEHGGCFNVINVPSVRNGKLHDYEKPTDLMKRLILASSKESELLIDPFLGCGTTLEAAKQLGRKAIGIEIEEKYCEIAAKRLSQEVLDFTG